MFLHNGWGTNDRFDGRLVDYKLVIDDGNVGLGGNMTTRVIAEFNCADGNAEKFAQMARELFPETRLFDGCESIDISIDTDDEKRLVMTENWTSKEHHQAYLAFETEDGTLAKLGALLSGPPEFSYLTLMDA